MPDSRKHILATFDDALNALHADVRNMSNLTERNLAAARQGLFERNDQACNSVIADDEAIDQLEKKVDQDGVAVLTRFQPVATDLRQVIAAMKVSGDLERVADQAVNIARKARKHIQHPALPELQLLAPMFQEAASLLADSLKSFWQGDLALASALKPRDKRLDAAKGDVTAQLTDRMAKDPANVPYYLDLIFIARHLERVGDHATNLAEEAVYATSAHDIRHMQQGGKTKVLFVCVHNSARSQMAEAWLQHLGGDAFDVKSAGVEPGTLNPLAIEAMREVGIDISRNLTRSVFDVFKTGELFHYVIAVCDKTSAERCPIFPGVTQRLEWSFPDPGAVTGSPEEKLEQTRHIRDAIHAKVEWWMREFGPSPEGVK